VRARLGGTPQFDRSLAEALFASVEERCRLRTKKQTHCWGQLQYDGLPWRGEIWLDDTLRLGPASRDGRIVIHGSCILRGPQVVLVDALIDGFDGHDAASAFSVRLRELSIFLSVVMRTAVRVPTNSTRAWTWTTGPDGKIECEVRLLGYCEVNRPAEFPAKGTAPPIRLKAVSRPDFSLPGQGELQETDRWLPADTVELWKRFSALPAGRRRQFLQAGNQWRLALIFRAESQTACFSKMVVACEALKPPGAEYDYHNIYDVVEALWGKPFAEAMRKGWLRPQVTRNAYFHRGELQADELTPSEWLSTFDDPSFMNASLWFPQIPPAAILEWLLLGGTVPPLSTKRLSWRKKGRIRQLVFAVLGGAGFLILGWLLRRWFDG
jgi:hypothetical protein